jgi:hypothetical protein
MRIFRNGSGLRLKCRSGEAQILRKAGAYFAWLAESGFTATIAGAMIIPINAIAINSSCMGEGLLSWLS